MKSINPQHQIAAEGSLSRKSRSEIIKTSKIEMVLKMHPSETCEVSVSEKKSITFGARKKRSLWRIQI